MVLRPLLLRGIQGGIRGFEQLVGAFESANRLARISNADRDGFFARQRVLNRGAQAFRQHRGRGFGSGGKDRAEFVAAVAAGVVGLARMFAQRLRYYFHGLVALCMAVQIVVELELVDVDAPAATAAARFESRARIRPED